MAETARSLSKTEAKVVLDLEWHDRKVVTLAELRSMLGGSDSHAKFLAHRLVAKGWLERIKRGVFQLVPANRGTEGISDTNALAAGALLVSPYFYSFGTACTHHGLTEQVFTEAYVACRASKRPTTVRGTRFVFVQMSEARFFGFVEADVLGEPVQMASKERALLDAVDRPHLAGGLPEVSRIVAKAAAEVSWQPLLEHVKRWEESALVQRLGYLLDLHQVEVPPGAKKKLLALVNPTSKVHLGSRAEWGTSGRLNHPWSVIENVPREQLVETAVGRRRLKSFPARKS
jgi:predicted transcriptional regulator of viral defense system